MNQSDFARTLNVSLGFGVNGLRSVVADRARFRALQNAVLSLRRAITGQHFEDEQTGPLSESAEVVQQVAAECVQAKRCFIEFKYREFSG